MPDPFLTAGHAGPAGALHSPNAPDAPRLALPAGGLALPAGVVQVWLLPEADVAQACRALAHTLSGDERERAGRYRFEHDRQRFIARRGMLRWLIGRYLGCEPAALRFGVDALGKPAWQWPAAPGLAFSVSQAESLALLAFARNCRLGIDVAQVIDGVDIAGVAREVFSPCEQNALAAARGEVRAAFFSTWSRKEALLKAMGTGLSGEPAAYATQADRRGGSRWRAWHHGAALGGWTLLDLAAGPQVRAALAVSLPQAQVWLGACALPGAGLPSR
ncbi:MAG: 4'-phosphopantetheinyl transferase superfamily protein [Pseudomonadota bacterium]|nr:4'-phosphopantetheinyl transferase superfamily protein [Pseudomonadota bacterium]